MKLELDKHKLLNLKGKNNEYLDLRREANHLINLKNHIIRGEYKYRDAISVLNEINIIMKLAEDYNHHTEVKIINKFLLLIQQ